MNFSFNYKELCKPARWYFYFAVLSTIIAFFQGASLGHLVGNVIFMGLFMWFLNKLCSWGYRTAAWVVLFLPMILFFVGIFIIVSRV